MIKTNCLLIILTLTIIFGCSSGDDNGSIIGTWRLVDAYSTTGFQMSVNDCTAKTQIKFYSNRSGELSNFGNIPDEGCVESVSEFTYTRVGNTLTMTVEGSSFEFRIEIREEILTQTYVIDNGEFTTYQWERID